MQIKFKIPNGVNFCCEKSVPINLLSNDLYEIMLFIKKQFDVKILQLYEDWLQHDGLIFLKSKVKIENLLNILQNHQKTLKSMPDDDYVRIGISTNIWNWYLRYYAKLNEKENIIEGNYDITLPDDYAITFKNELLSKLSDKLVEKKSIVYFENIIVRK